MDLILHVALDDHREGPALDTARQITREANRLEQAFTFATEDAPIRATIANLRAVATALTEAHQSAQALADA